MMAGLCSAIAASIAARSSVKSGRSGTPTNSSPANCADIAYMTKPGTGASTLAPGLAAASDRMLMISSEPLPSSTSMPAGTFITVLSGAQRLAARHRIAIQRDLAEPRGQLRAQLGRQPVRILHRVELHQSVRIGHVVGAHGAHVVTDDAFDQGWVYG
jgi:hypothetical protein